MSRPSEQFHRLQLQGFIRPFIFDKKTWFKGTYSLTEAKLHNPQDIAIYIRLSTTHIVSVTGNYTIITDYYLALEERNMANEFLIKKWRMWFSWFDTNKDGKVCSEDLDTAKNKFAQLHRFEGERKKAAIDTYSLWWSEYLMWGKPEITEDEFVECQNAAFKTDKEEFIKRMQKNQNMVCDLIDTSRDGFITEEDLFIIFKSSGHTDGSVVRRWYNANNPVDGKVDVKAMADLWVNFLTCEDSSKPDVIKQQFEAGL